MSDFELSRSAHVEADPATVHALIDDFRAWRRWSPWEDVDPDLRRTFTGPPAGVGSHYAWAGNKKAGEGTMEITRSEPGRLVEVDLRFLKPFKAHNTTTFALAPSTSGTDVVWTMTGHRSWLMSLMGRLFFDKAIGGDFEQGLSRLKSAAESG